MRHKSPSAESTKAQVCSKSSNLLNQKHSYVKLEILLIHILQVNETNHHYEVNLNQYQFSRK